MRSKTVLISGAGIAGPTLAYWLNAAGFETTIVERAPRLRTGGYVIDFWGLGYDIAERMGLATDLGRSATTFASSGWSTARANAWPDLVQKAFDALTGGRFITLRRSDLSRLVLEAADSSSEVLFDDEIVSLHGKAGLRRGSIPRRGRARLRPRRRRRRPPSKVAHAGLRSAGSFEKRLGYSVAAFEVRGYRPRDKDVYVIHNEPGRMVGRVALRNDRTFFLFVFADDDPRPSPHDFATHRRILQATFGSARWECAQILDRLDDVTELYFDRVSQIKMDKWSHGRVALVGDAAFCVSLLAGQGSALAMTAAYALGGELAKADGDYHAAFRAYERLLRPFIAKKQKGAERFSAAFAPRTGWGLLLRNQVVKACAIPAVARFAFSRDITDTLRLPDYVWPALERIW